MSKLGKLLQRGHESLIVMSTACCIYEHNIEVLARRMGNGIFGHSCGVLAIALLVELDLATLASRELLQVAHMNCQLLDSTGAEGIAGRDEDLVFVLQQEEANFRQISRFAYAVDSNDGHDVGPGFSEGGDGGCCDGVDLAKEIERGRGSQHFC